MKTSIAHLNPVSNMHLFPDLPGLYESIDIGCLKSDTTRAVGSPARPYQIMRRQSQSFTVDLFHWYLREPHSQRHGSGNLNPDDGTSTFVLHSSSYTVRTVIRNLLPRRIANRYLSPSHHVRHRLLVHPHRRHHLLQHTQHLAGILVFA